MVYYMEKPSRMDNHRSKWAMFNSYVSLPEGTKKVILPTIIRVLALLSWCIFEIHEEESHFGSPKCMVLRCWVFWDYIHFYSPSNARKYVLLFALIHTRGHHCFFPRYQWYHSLPMTIIQSSCEPHCSAKRAL
jgi:hypothetical protein